MSQAQNLKFLLEDGEPHSTDEILREVYGGSHLGIARIGARIYDLKKRGMNIESWKDAKRKTIWWYRLISSPSIKIEKESANKLSQSQSEREQPAMFELKKAL